MGDILDRLAETACGTERVSVGDIVEAFGHRSYGPLLIVPGLIELSPIGAIPGVPTALAAIVVVFAGQILIGRSHLWLPRIIAARTIGAARLSDSVARLRPVGRWLDRWFHGRLPVLTRGLFVRLAAAACIVLALTVPPLELIPFASSAPMSTIAMFGMALFVRDGALMLAAMLFPFLAAAIGYGLFKIAD